MEITRRKFFFFGLAAGIGLLLPDKKILIPEFTWDKTRIDVISETDIIAAEFDRIMPNVRRLFESDDLFFSTLKKKTEYISLP